VHGEPIFYAVADVSLKAPIVPKKFFHTAEIFGSTTRSDQGRLLASSDAMDVFFQNVDAIIGHDEPVIYPAHLTQELDYELELAVVLKKLASTSVQKKPAAT